MKTFGIGPVLAALIAAVGCSPPTTQPAAAGPNGGDLVPIKGGTAYAELLANADTGEVMVHTWDKDLKTPRPVERAPVVVGSGNDRTELTPHPTPGDPPGYSSRFYGHADWMRGGHVRHGWLAMQGGEGQHQPFDWRNCWQAGRQHGRMWEEMGEHRHMAPGMKGHGPGMPGKGPGQHGGVEP